jgi:hypothetical protein
MRRVTLGLAFLTVVLLASDSSAQSIRVTSDDAVLYVAASERSAVVARPPRGSILELARTEGDWYVVLLAPDAQGLRRYGYLRTRQAEAAAGAGTPAAAPPTAAAPRAALPALAPDWDARFRAARSKKASGRAKFWSGVVALAGGAGLLAVMTMKMTESEGPTGECSYQNPCPEYAWGLGAAGGLLAGGGILTARGKRQARAADEELIQLRTERANLKSDASIAIPLDTGGKHRAALILGAGQRLHAHFQVRW